MNNDGKILVSIVAPCYNEGETVEPFLRRVRLVAASMSEYAFEYVFVDDGSLDDTAMRIKVEADRDPCVKLISLSRNFGHQRAITAGLEFCVGDLIVVIDADLQDPPEKIPEILERLSSDCDLVHMVRSDRSVDSFMKRASARMFYALMRRYALPEMASDGPDFKGFNRDVLNALLQYRERVRFLRGIFATLGFRQASIPYERAARHAGGTKYSLRKMFALGRDAMVSFSVLPLRVGFIVGAPSIGLAVIIGVFAIFKGLFLGGLHAPGQTVIIIMLSGFSGLILMALGAIGEYLGCLIREAKRRPLYIVRALVNITPRDIQKPPRV
jgi:dolichol-phosphate mannosyltransferase